MGDARLSRPLPASLCPAKLRGVNECRKAAPAPTANGLPFQWFNLVVRGIAILGYRQWNPALESASLA